MNELNNTANMDTSKINKGLEKNLKEHFEKIENHNKTDSNDNKTSADNELQNQNIYENALKIDRVPPKKDIISHFEKNTEKYSEFYNVFDSDGKDELEVSASNKLTEFLKRNLKYIGNKILDVASMLFCSFNELSVNEKVLVMGALGYLIFPIDLVSDFIPGIGFVDDSIILCYVLDMLKDKISLEISAKAEEFKKQIYNRNENETNFEKTETDFNDSFSNSTNLKVSDIPEKINGVKTIKYF